MKDETLSTDSTHANKKLVQSFSVHNIKKKKKKNKKKKEKKNIKKKKILINILIKIKKQKNFERIKISDICEEALINRSTFYSHYEDKYDLLMDLFEEQKLTLLKELNVNENKSFSKKYLMDLLSILIIFINFIFFFFFNFFYFFFFFFFL